MTAITVTNIRITGSQIWVNMNGINSCLGSYETSVLLSHLTEKKITIESREYHKHNDHESFKNQFMIRLNQILHNANYNKFPLMDKLGNSTKFDTPYWLIDTIQYNENNIIVTIRNLMNEKLEDNG